MLSIFDNEENGFFRPHSSSMSRFFGLNFFTLGFWVSLCSGSAVKGKLSVDIPAVADSDNQYFQSNVLDVGYDSVIADAVFP